MRFTVLSSLVLMLLSSYPTLAQDEDWQQKVDHEIVVTLDHKNRSINGFEKISYLNNSPDTLTCIYFHLWPNAYKNDRTAFSEQLLKNNRKDFYFSADSLKGYINHLRFMVDGTTAKLVDDPFHQDIAKLILPKPLYPGNSIQITTPFHVRLPYMFSRSGYKENLYAITQWYPKPAVYDKDGWHPMPYLDQGEYYNEFGEYNVSISVPRKFKVAATGHLVSTDSTKDGTNIYHYTQNDIHDFAWFASPDFHILTDTMILPSGKKIDLFSYYLPHHEKLWSGSIQMMKDAISSRSKWIGDFPYNVMTVIDGMQEGNGGMEYPTITVINEAASKSMLEYVIAHEIGHNWFYGALANNERSYPWLDEGLNSFYDNRYRKFRKLNYLEELNFLGKRIPENDEILATRITESLHRDQPINTPADSFATFNYGAIIYAKTAEWLELLEKKLGTENFDNSIRSFYSLYKFHHTSPESFQNIIQLAGGETDEIFDQLNKTGPLENPSKRTHKFTFLFNGRDSDKYRYTCFAPLPGYNLYNGFMVGLLVHNFQLPVPKFRFLLAPMYGTKSKSLAGLGYASYNWYPKNFLHQVEAGIQLSRFSNFHFREDDIFLHYTKFAPFVKFILPENNPLSKRERQLMARSFFFREDELTSETIIEGTDTTTINGKKNVARNLQQVRYYVGNHRTLYPYEIDARVDFNKDFSRMAITASGLLNYSDEGGLKLRLFAGKFFYLGQKTFTKEYNTDRYHLNLTGANGYEDYTYSDYFIGRNEYSGWESQQIMMREGAFKVRSDLLSTKIGKSDDWLVAINLTSDIPKKFNPLQLLPVKIPLKVFADFGTYAEAWDEKSDNSRLLFDTGIQVSLFKEMLNIYFPLFYSKVFRDYNHSVLGDKEFVKTISFSIDIQQIRSRKLLASIGL